MLPKEAILEFQEIYKKAHGVDISFEEAAMKSEELIALFQTIYKPIKRSSLDTESK